MRIRRARVGSFGAMRDRSFEFGDGLNVVYGPNEAGKTTLKTFVTTSFFKMRNKKGLYPSKSATDRGEVDVVMSDGTERTLRRKGSATDDLSQELGITDAEYTSIYSMEPEDLRRLDVVEEGKVRDRMLTIPGAADVPKVSGEIEDARKAYIGEKWRADGGIAKLMAAEDAAGRRVAELRERENGDDSYNSLVRRRSELEKTLEERGKAVDSLTEADRAATLEADRERTRASIEDLRDRETELAASEHFSEEAEKTLNGLDADIEPKREAAEASKARLQTAARALGGRDPAPYIANSAEIRALESSVPQYRADAGTVDRLKLSASADEEASATYRELTSETEKADNDLRNWSARRDAERGSMDADPEKVLSHRQRIEGVLRKSEGHGKAAPEPVRRAEPKGGVGTKGVIAGAVVAAIGVVIVALGWLIPGAVVAALGAATAFIFLMKRSSNRTGERPPALPSAAGARDADMEFELQGLMMDLGMRYTTYEAGVLALSSALKGADRWDEACGKVEAAESAKSDAEARLNAFVAPYGGAHGFEAAAAARPEYSKAKREMADLETRARRTASATGCPWTTFPDTVRSMSEALSASLAWKGAKGASDAADRELGNAEKGRDLFLSGFGGREAFEKGVRDRKELESVRSQISALRANVPERPEGPVDAAKAKEDLAAATRAFNEANEELAGVRQAIRDIESDGTVEDAITARSRAEAAVYAAVGEWAELAIEDALLSEASEAASAKHRPEVLTRADGFLSEMTGGRYRISSDPHDLTVTVVSEDGSRKGDGEWSSGLRDQVALSLKMAVALSLSGERPPVILDDVLLTSDSDRKAGGCRALRELSRDVQVVYFTCDRETRDLMVSEGAGLIMI